MKPEPELSFNEAVKAHTEAGWEVVSDGPTGVQFRGPKKMKGSDKAALIFGILTCWIYGFGLIFIGLAMLDYWFLTKPPTIFLNRPL